MRHACMATCATVLILMAAGSALGQSFVNWETPHIHPISLTPDGSKLLTVNLADGRLEVFSLANGTPRAIASVLRGTAVQAALLP